MSGHTDYEWLGLLMVSEDVNPVAWPAIGCVVINRASHQRWPNTIREVVLQAQQFSYFNAFAGAGLDPDEIYLAATIGTIPAGGIHAAQVRVRRLGTSLLPEANACADWLVRARPWERPLGRDACFMYAPRSMVPTGSKPWWWDEESMLERGRSGPGEAFQTITLPHLPDWRFGTVR